MTVTHDLVQNVTEVIGVPQPVSGSRNALTREPLCDGYALLAADHRSRVFLAAPESMA
ncbi:hypothetical protein T45_03923 [Streptomyces turgidiscabies]|nr:hypothetical protein T45_03923 [Streptomyces turgidiscabies]